MGSLRRWGKLYADGFCFRPVTLEQGECVQAMTEAGLADTAHLLGAAGAEEYMRRVGEMFTGWSVDEMHRLSAGEEISAVVGDDRAAVLQSSSDRLNEWARETTR